ncbi:MAG: hypothetical protein AAB074_13865 [Planctomycetota bacterium]
MRRTCAVAVLALAVAGHVNAEEPRARDLRLVYLEGSQIKTWDADTGKGAVLANEASSLQFHPQTRRVLFTELESVFVSDLGGAKTRVFTMPKIVHPGCGHIESSIHGVVFCDGGKSVLFRYRVVPEGVDPHEDSDAQMRSAIVRTDGTERVELAQQPCLHSDSGNVGPGDFSPDGKRSILSRGTRGPGPEGAVAIELREHDALGGGDGREIDRFDLKSLFYLNGAWSPKGDQYAYLIASITYRKYELRVWDGVKARKIAEGNCSLGLGGTGSMVLGWSPDGSRLTLLPRDEARKPLVQVIDVAAGRAASTFAVGPEPTAPAWLSDSRRIAVVDFGACPHKTTHQHRFAECRTRLLLLDSGGKAGDAPVELAATEKLAYAAPIATPDGKSLLVFTIASERVPPGEWVEATERVYGLKTLDLATGKLSAALPGLSFSTIPSIVVVEAK